MVSHHANYRWESQSDSGSQILKELLLSILGKASYALLEKHRRDAENAAAT
jgi:hypothetical protein